LSCREPSLEKEKGQVHSKNKRRRWTPIIFYQKKYL